MTQYKTMEIDGLKIFFREGGDPAKPALLLLHGFPASSFMFRDLMVRLSDEFYVIAPDYPGFGYSDAPSRDKFAYTFDRLAEVIGSFIDRQKILKFGIYMQDFGGPVGFRLASQRPDQVSFLVVQNANAYDEGLPDSFWALPRTLWSNPTPDNFQKIRDAAMSDDALAWNYTHGVKDESRISPDSWVLQQALVNRPGNKEIMLDLLYDYRSNPPLYPQWQEYLRRHQPPTLVVWGKNDEIFPESGAHPYRRDLKTIELNILDTGHFALEDHADVIAGHIQRFAKTLAL